MLNLIQHLTKSRTYETLKQVQGDKLGLFTRPSDLDIKIIFALPYALCPLPFLCGHREIDFEGRTFSCFTLHPYFTAHGFDNP